MDHPRGRLAWNQVSSEFDVVVDPWQLPRVTTLARSVESATFVLDHLGNPPLASGSLEQWSVDIAALAECSNVVAKISGLVTKDDWEQWTVDGLRSVVDFAVDAFGPSRLMFGSDWPLAELAGGYRPWKNAYTELTDQLSPAEQASIDQLTARRVYGLR